MDEFIGEVDEKQFFNIFFPFLSSDKRKGRRRKKLMIQET